MFTTYRRVLALPGALVFSASGLVARMPVAMVSLGIVLLGSTRTGSYSVAKNAVAWADKAGVALFLLDLYGGLQQMNAVAKSMRSPLPDGPPKEDE